LAGDRLDDRLGDVATRWEATCQRVVGQWAPSFLLFGIYNKLVKQLGFGWDVGVTARRSLDCQKRPGLSTQTPVAATNPNKRLDRLLRLYDGEALTVVIETPRAPRINAPTRGNTGRVLSGVLPAGAVFPFDFGVVPSTLATMAIRSTSWS